MSQIPDNSKVIIDASKTINIHEDVQEIIKEFEENAQYRNIELELIDVNSVKIGNQGKIVQKVLAENGHKIDSKKAVLN